MITINVINWNQCCSDCKWLHEIGRWHDAVECVSQYVVSCCWRCLLQDVPPPTAYDVDKSFQMTQVKKELRPPRNDAAKRRHESFMSSTARFVPPRDVVLAESDPSIPGTRLTINESCNSTRTHGDVIVNLLKVITAQHVFSFLWQSCFQCLELSYLQM